MSKLQGKNATEWVSEAERFANQQNFQESIRCYSLAIQLDNKNPLYFHNRGNNYVRVGKFPDALSDFTNAIKIADYEANFWFGRGSCYFVVGKYAEAIQDFSTAIELNGKESYYWNNRGNSFDILGKCMVIAREKYQILENFLLEGMHRSSFDEVVLMVMCSEYTPKEEEGFTTSKSIATKLNSIDKFEAARKMIEENFIIKLYERVSKAIYTHSKLLESNSSSDEIEKLEKYVEQGLRVIGEVMLRSMDIKEDLHPICEHVLTQTALDAFSNLPFTEPLSCHVINLASVLIRGLIHYSNPSNLPTKDKESKEQSSKINSSNCKDLITSIGKYFTKKCEDVITILKPNDGKSYDSENVVGEKRMLITEFVGVVMGLNLPEVNSSFLSSKIFEMMSQIFFKFEKNNFFHFHFLTICRAILNPRPTVNSDNNSDNNSSNNNNLNNDLTKLLIGESFLKGMMKVVKDSHNGMEVKGSSTNKRVRGCSMGHIISLSNMMLANESIKSAISDQTEWKQWSEELKEENVRQKVLLGGEHPLSIIEKKNDDDSSSGDSSDSSDDDEEEEEESKEKTSPGHMEGGKFDDDSDSDSDSDDDDPTLVTTKNNKSDGDGTKENEGDKEGDEEKKKKNEKEEKDSDSEDSSDSDDDFDSTMISKKDNKEEKKDDEKNEDKEKKSDSDEDKKKEKETNKDLNTEKKGENSEDKVKDKDFELMSQLNKKNTELENTVSQLKKENKDLKDQVDTLQKQVETLNQQLKLRPV